MSGMSSEISVCRDGRKQEFACHNCAHWKKSIKEMFKELDIVKLKIPNEELGIGVDNEGVIVDVLGNGEAFTVEFFDVDNKTIMESLFVEFTPEQLTLVERYVT